MEFRRQPGFAPQKSMESRLQPGFCLGEEKTRLRPELHALSSEDPKEEGPGRIPEWDGSAARLKRGELLADGWGGLEKTAPRETLVSAGSDQNDGLSSIFEPRKVLGGRPLALNANSIVRVHLPDAGFGAIHSQAEGDLERLALGHGDQIELVRRLIVDEHRPGLRVDSEYTAFERENLAASLRLCGAHTER